MANAFVLALYEIANEEGNTASLEAIRNKAFAKLQCGEAKSLVTSSLNGKSFSFTISKAADVLFSEATQAIRLYNNGVVTSTGFDFMWI